MKLEPAIDGLITGVGRFVLNPSRIAHSIPGRGEYSEFLMQGIPLRLQGVYLYVSQLMGIQMTIASPDLIVALSLPTLKYSFARSARAAAHSSRLSALEMRNKSASLCGL